jgi:ribonuclease P protein component
LNREFRLRERERFEQVRRKGSCWTDRLIVLCALPNGLARSRFGFSVSRRVGNAVVRNRLKRRLREVVRLQLQGIAVGWDVVFIARPPIARADYREIERVVGRLLRQAGLVLPVTLQQPAQDVVA